MSCHASSSNLLDCRLVSKLPTVVYSGGKALFFLIILLCLGGSALAANIKTDIKRKETAQSCAAFGAEFDPATDVHALQEYQYAIADLLKHEQFKELDCIADSARSSKAKFSGGMWKLHKVYSGLDEPQPGHATEQDWRDHLGRLNRWEAMRPKSITARVALAKSYVGYAWNARGDGFSDTVSESGWKLFVQRLKKAQTILDQAKTLHTKCPEWYVAMQQVALGQSWDSPRAAALFDQAVAFEPGYDLYYRMRTNYLLPQWHGEEGDPARFAEQAANRVGGRAGDILYFQIATEVSCACADTEFGRMSWERLQKGFAALEQDYGVSLINVNLFALMAFNFQDSVVADAAFKRIGDNWDKDTWKTEEWFKQNKTWAAQFAPTEARSKAIKQEAAANLQTVEGASYKKDFDLKFAPFERSCVQKAGKDRDKFEFLIKIGKDGGADDGWFTQPTSVAICLMQDLGASHARKESVFPPPPHDSYWIILDLDPATVNTAAAK
jgi:hypothetical protein